jgi:quercetin dioxygenase-like cupin family protein
MTRITVLLGLGLLLVGTSYAQQNAPLFTGKSVVMDGKDLSAARRSFEPGARTFWHSHDNGQLLLVEDGRMRTQKKGGPVKELGKGDSDYTGPTVVHWHGAVPGQALVQINVGFGGETKWMNEVTEAEYNKREN